MIAPLFCERNMYDSWNDLCFPSRRWVGYKALDSRVNGFQRAKMRRQLADHHQTFHPVGNAGQPEIASGISQHLQADRQHAQHRAAKPLHPGKIDHDICNAIGHDLFDIVLKRNNRRPTHQSTRYSHNSDVVANVNSYSHQFGEQLFKNWMLKKILCILICKTLHGRIHRIQGRKNICQLRNHQNTFNLPGDARQSQIAAFTAQRRQTRR